jgi:hypothetical protein
MPDFFPLWSGAPDGVLEYKGRQLRIAHWIDVAKGDRLHVIIEGFTDRPVQGVRLTLEDRRGGLEIVGQQSRSFVLWTDTAPRHVECLVAKAKRGARLSLVNVWRDEEYGTTMQGLNAAAIDVQPQADGSTILQCSDGWGTEADFTDLVVRLIIEPASATGQPRQAAV